MTTSELIQILSQYPPDTRVMVDGYEGGADDIADVRAAYINPDANMAACTYGASRTSSPTTPVKGATNSARTEESRWCTSGARTPCRRIDITDEIDGRSPDG